MILHGEDGSFLEQKFSINTNLMLCLSKIENKSGEVIYEPIPESHDVLNKDIAFAIIKLLEGVTESGSGVRLRTQGGGSGDSRWTGYPYMFTNPIAGKTGTSQNQSDQLGCYPVN